jgi:hypothetical protein
MSMPILEKTLTEASAEQAVIDLKNGLEQAKEAAYTLWNGGWQLLKGKDGLCYTSFHAAIQDRFEDKSVSYVYRLKDTREIELAVSTNGDTLSLKESHVRVLKKLSNADAQVKVLDTARKLADAEGAEDLTARHLEKAVENMRAEQVIQDSPHGVIKHLFADGEISMSTAALAVQELNKLAPQQQFQAQEIIAKAGGLKDAQLIPHLGEMLKRDNSNPSLVLQWIKDTGDVFDTALKDATINDLNRAKKEAQRVHAEEEKRKKQEADRAEGKAIVEEVICTLYKGDASKTAKTLKNLLGDDDYANLRQVFVNEWLNG